MPSLNGEGTQSRCCCGCVWKIQSAAYNVYWACMCILIDTHMYSFSVYFFFLLSLYLYVYSHTPILVQMALFTFICKSYLSFHIHASRPISNVFFFFSNVFWWWNTSSHKKHICFFFFFWLRESEISCVCVAFMKLLDPKAKVTCSLLLEYNPWIQLSRRLGDNPLHDECTEDGVDYLPTLQ